MGLRSDAAGLSADALVAGLVSDLVLEAPTIDDLERPQQIAAALGLVRGILAGQGVADAPADALLVPGPDGATSGLLPAPNAFWPFIARFAVEGRFSGYRREDLAGLTLQQVCEKYVDESFPEPPTVPLDDAAYALGPQSTTQPPATEPSDFPIAFVLGSGRSGTTLFRVMLDAHPTVWAPGELHLAQYADMAQRAQEIVPVLRRMIVPDVAARLGESEEAFGERLAQWERDALPIADVFDALHRANPDVLIVDKTPPYSESLDTLARIGEQFPNARYVHLVRNPHDVIRSLVTMQLYKRHRDAFPAGISPYQIAEVLWVRNNRNIELFLEGVPSDRKCLVHYESLVADPEASLARVCAVLGRAYDPRMADPYRDRSEFFVRGAGDMTVSGRGRVEQRTAGSAFYPLGARCRTLAAHYGY